jgi:hypothetical protein
VIGRSILFALAVLATATPARAFAENAAPDAPGDSLGAYFKGLSDSTDVSFGAQSVTFDTTGLDSLAWSALDRPPSLERRRRGLALTPLLGFHRAEGWIFGAGGRLGSRPAGWFDGSGTYGFANREGRYAAGYRRTLFYRGPRSARVLADAGRIADEATRLDAEVRYARASLPFMPEHASARLFNFSAALTGKDSPSLYEQRGVTGALTLWTGDWRFGLGVRHAQEEAMFLETDWVLVGKRSEVPPNTLAQPDEYTEPFGGIGFYRSDWELGALVEGRGGGADRWRLRSVLAKALRLGGSVKAYAQIEGGAAAANAPPQRRFELGGVRAVPTLPVDVGGTDHLLLGKLEFIEAHDLLGAVGLPHPDWLVLQPMLFFHGGAVWDDAGGRNIVFSTPPSEAWRGAAGAGLAYRLGIPEPDVLARLYVAWPIGPRSGTTQFRVSIGTTFDLLGRL